MRWIGFSEIGRIPLNRGDEEIRLAFGDLAEEFRLPLWFSMGLGLSHAEISEVLGVPRDCVKKSIGIGCGLLLLACEAAGNEGDMQAIESLLARMASEPAPASLMDKLTRLTDSGGSPGRRGRSGKLRPGRMPTEANLSRRSRVGGDFGWALTGKRRPAGPVERMRHQ